MITFNLDETEHILADPSVLHELSEQNILDSEKNNLSSFIIM